MKHEIPLLAKKLLFVAFNITERKTLVVFLFTLYISIPRRVSMGTRRHSCSKKSILNLCWWSAQIPHYSRGCIVTHFLIYYCLLYLITKYLKTCALMAHTGSVSVWMPPWSCQTIIIAVSDRGKALDLCRDNTIIAQWPLDRYRAV